MRLLVRLIVLLVHFDRLVRLGCDKPRPGLIERHRKDSRLTVHRPGLHGRLNALEVIARAPVPHEHRSVVTARDQHPVRIHRHAIDDRIVATQVLNEVSLGTTPLFDIVRRGGGERVLRRMDHHGTDALLVISQRADALSGRQVPQTDRRVVASGDDLRIRRLRHHTADRVRVPGQRVDVRLRSHVPDPSGGVSTGSDQDVDRGVQRHRIDGGQVAVVVTDDFVVLQVPALDLAVLSATEQVRVSSTDRQSPHRAHVAGQAEFQFSRGQVPDLDDAICSTGGEPFVARLDGDASHPAEVAGDDAVEFPGSVPFGFGDGGRLLRDQLDVAGGARGAGAHVAVLVGDNAVVGLGRSQCGGCVHERQFGNLRRFIGGGFSSGRRFRFAGGVFHAVEDQVVAVASFDGLAEVLAGRRGELGGVSWDMISLTPFCLRRLGPEFDSR